MKNKILIALLLICYSLLQGCAASRYPGYQDIKISGSVAGEPCIEKSKPEICVKASEGCLAWFQKRATRKNANVIVPIEFQGKTQAKYYSCEIGNPIFEVEIFNDDNYKLGSNTITGQALLRQLNGNAITCAGNIVTLFPNNEYYHNMSYIELFGGTLPENAKKLIKTTFCDAQGNFHFENIPDGKWTLIADVKWSIVTGYTRFSLPINKLYRQSLTHVHTSVTGDLLVENVVVKTGKMNRFIMSK